MASPSADGRLPIHFLLSNCFPKIEKDFRSDSDFDSFLSSLISDARYTIPKVCFKLVLSFSFSQGRCRHAQKMGRLRETLFFISAFDRSLFALSKLSLLVGPKSPERM